MPYRRRRGRRRSLGNVIQSYKKVLSPGPASHAAATQIDTTISNGVDSVAAGQTSATDPDVPVGAVIKYIEIQYSVQNLVSIACTQWMSIQRTHTGQSNLAPFAVGGSPQRNQTHYQLVRMLGNDQNNNMTLRFKVPSKFQRVREGDKWIFSVYADAIVTDVAQIIYKFYR